MGRKKKESEASGFLTSKREEYFMGLGIKRRSKFGGGAEEVCLRHTKCD
jgi:hypothetical protein